MNRSIIVLMMVLLGGAVGHAQMQKLPLRISVEKIKESDRVLLQKPKSASSGCKTTHYAKVTKKTESVALQIKFQLMGAKPAKDLRVEYLIVGRDRSSRELSLASKGEQTVELKPMQSSSINTEAVDFGEYDVKFVTGASSAHNRKSGIEYYGVVVNVYQGSSSPVTTFYEPPSLEQKVDSLLKEKKKKQ